MKPTFADRISDVPKSFIREILKVTLDASVISFAGGLPNRNLFPVGPLQQATEKVFVNDGMDALQYASSEGFAPLREFIARHYAEKEQLKVNPEHIIITTGSQQGLDLLGKVFINGGDDLIIEEPGYLGAIQAFSIYQPTFHPVAVDDHGMDLDRLEETLKKAAPKMMYMVPNFQNPAGISYDENNRQEIARLIKETDCILIQDDPYGELRFSGTPKTNFYKLLPEQTILLGSFSKTVAPALRIGWMVVPPALIDKIITAKQAADLHTNTLAQRIIYQFVTDNDLDGHIATIIDAYGTQKEAMKNCMTKYFPAEVRTTDPEGGMFLWATLPKGASSLKLFDLAVQEKVVFVPGTPFYLNRADVNTLRINFSCSDPETIDVGIKRLGNAMKTILAG